MVTNVSIEPKPEHIERLMANPAEHQLFDEIYGEGASLKYLDATQIEATKPQEQEPEQQELEPQTGFFGNVKSGIKEGGRETLETIQGISNYLKETFPDFNYTIRRDEDGIRIVSPDERRDEKIAQGKDPDKEEGGLFQTIADTIPESPEAEGTVGSLTRGISQFSTGFVTGGRILNALGWTKKANQGYNVARSFVQGGIADFTVFDEKEARLSDFIIEAFPEANDTFIAYMAADEDDTFFEGKMKNVLEGSLIGGAAELLFRTIRMMRGTRKRLDKDGEEVAGKYAEKEAKEIEELQNKVDAEQLELFPDDARLNTPRQQVDEGAEISATKGLDEAKRFNVKALKETDYFKQVQSVIKAIRDGKADIEDLEEIGVSTKFLGDGVDAVTFVRAMAQEINKVTKEFDDIKSYDQVWRQADEMLEDPTEAIIKAQQLAKLTDKGDAIQIALRMAFNGVLNAHLAKDALHQVGKLSDDEILKSWDLVTTLYRLDRQIGKNTARALNVRKELVQGSSRSKKKTMELLEQAEIIPKGDSKATLEIVKKVRSANKEKKGIMAVLQAVQEKLGINYLNKFWINALLSNPKTHAINMTSNLIMAVIRPMEQYIGGVVSGNKSARVEAINTAVGIIKFYADSFYAAKQAFAKSDSILDKNNFKVDLAQGAFKRNPSAADKIIEAPTRFLSAEDEFFKQLSYRAKVYGQVVAEGVAKGLSKKKVYRTSQGRMYSDLDSYVENRFRKAFLRDNSANTEKFKSALEYAQENTFTRALGEKTPGKLVQTAVNTVPLLRQVIPFVRTPINIMRAVGDRSPLGFAREQFRKDFFSPDRNIRAQAYGKQLVGASLFTMGGILAYNGMITGGVPRDTNLRRQKFDTGWRPYSFKIGDKYVSFERLDPFGMFFGLMADYYDISLEVTEDERAQLAEANLLALMNKMDADDFADIGVGSVMVTVKNVTSKTYLKSLFDFMDAAMSNDVRKWKKYGLQKGGSFVPNIIKGISNDPLYRDARSLTDTLKTRIGFYGNVDPSFNALGEVRSRNQSWWDSFLNPFTISEDQEDIVMKEFDRLGVGFDPLGTKQGYAGNIDLTKFTKDGKKDGKSAFVRYNELIGQDGKLRKELERLIGSNFYQNQLNDKPIDDTLNYRSSKATLIRETINKYKRIARAKLLTEGFLTEGNLKLSEAYTNDKRNQGISKLQGGVLLPTE